MEGSVRALRLATTLARSANPVAVCEVDLQVEQVRQLHRLRPEGPLRLPLRQVPSDGAGLIATVGCDNSGRSRSARSVRRPSDAGWPSRCEPPSAATAEPDQGNLIGYAAVTTSAASCGRSTRRNAYPSRSCSKCNCDEISTERRLKVLVPRQAPGSRSTVVTGYLSAHGRPLRRGTPDLGFGGASGGLDWIHTVATDSPGWCHRARRVKDG
jgi:hypothetical protein